MFIAIDLLYLGNSMCANDKVTVISFDEIYISLHRLCFDKKNQQVLGPYKCVQIVLAMGKT